ncbi:MAG TPA: magnesium transporter [Bacillota bacterium]|nr:magnesium transporter [Bacillota bacterium]HPF42186.1 magnesium transporter [Bacillota bacterium]HPJ85691.1 magnesium transporter [Bacillota bacterium]HPQ61672.1 magnesium transporter [Bacillota bacterium]HRX91988.1 magnesium transporter [Candidatus Izemoplasmatales bacterium]
MENEDRTINTKEIIDVLKSNAELLEKREKLDNYHDYDLAVAMLEMTEEERSDFYRILDFPLLSAVFSELDPHDAKDVLDNAPVAVMTAVFKGMQTDDVVDIIDCIDDSDMRMAYLSVIDAKKRIEVKKMLEYDDSLVGSIMNNNYLEIKRTDTVKMAIATMVQKAPETEFINNIYVVDKGILVGVLSLKEIISAGNKPDTLIEDIMTVKIVSVTPWQKTEDAIELMKNYDFFLLPVVTGDFKMLGIIAFDDMFEALNKESDEDYSKLAGLTDINIDEDRETVWTTVKKRMPWLAILLFINLVTSSIITGYEDLLSRVLTLAIFMPLILNLAGNTGTQSLGIVIRLFATNQLDDKKAIRKHLIRELLIGIANGLAMGILIFGIVIGMRMLEGMAFVDVLPLAIVISVSLSASLAVATLAGSVVPLVLNLFKIDPAVASGPFITTVNDIISLLIYFGLATTLLARYF